MILAAESAVVSGNTFFISWVAFAMAFPRIPFSTFPSIYAKSKGPSMNGPSAIISSFSSDSVTPVLFN